MGISFNRLFLLYVIQFSFALLAFILSMNSLLPHRSYENYVYENRWTGTAIFMIISSSFVMIIWLMIVLPLMFTGEVMEFIDIYTTEPAFVIDLGIIVPVTFWCGISLLRKKPTAYQLAPVLLIMYFVVGALVILQLLFQLSFGLEINVIQFISMIVSFVALGVFALILSLRLLYHLKKI